MLGCDRCACVIPCSWLSLRKLLPILHIWRRYYNSKQIPNRCVFCEAFVWGVYSTCLVCTCCYLCLQTMNITPIRYWLHLSRGHTCTCVAYLTINRHIFIVIILYNYSRQLIILWIFLPLYRKNVMFQLQCSCCKRWDLPEAQTLPLPLIGPTFDHQSPPSNSPCDGHMTWNQLNSKPR